ncbi:hypothetical protein [Lysobacter gummosus]|uniref:hypothetical protein n=1 Tax=Lysobacter gummosus TaxID=262324 RepID=UPI003629B59E
MTSKKQQMLSTSLSALVHSHGNRDSSTAQAMTRPTQTRLSACPYAPQAPPA